MGKVTSINTAAADYLRGVTLTGEETTIKILESNAEKRAALANHDLASLKTVALQSGVSGINPWT